MNHVFEDVCHAISNINPHAPGSSDFPSWKASSDGQFSLKSVYMLLDPNPVSPSIPLFKKVWDWSGPFRMKSTLWKIAHGRLLTNSERLKRGMSADDLYPRCHLYPETLMHVLRDCEQVHEFWSKNISPNH